MQKCYLVILKLYAFQRYAHYTLYVDENHNNKKPLSKVITRMRKYSTETQFYYLKSLEYLLTVTL